MSELCFDFSEIKLHNKEQKLGFRYIDDLDLIGPLSETISDEEENLLYETFQSVLKNMKKAETLADVEAIAEQLLRNSLFSVTVDLRLENDDSRMETWAVLKWTIDEEQLFGRHISDEVYGEYSWNLVFPEGKIKL